MMRGAIGRRKRRNEVLQAVERVAHVRVLVQTRTCLAFLRHGLNVHTAAVVGGSLSTAGQVSGTLEVSRGEGLPRSRLQYPRGEVGLLGLAGQLGGGAQVGLA